MPRYDFQCRECATVSEITMDGPLQTMKLEHRDEDGAVCEGTFDRVWTKFGVGRIYGAGDSPGRQ